MTSLSIGVVVTASVTANTTRAAPLVSIYGFKSRKMVGGKQCARVLFHRRDSAGGHGAERTLALLAAHYITHHTSLVQEARGLSSHS